MRGVQRNMLRGLVDWLVESGRLALVDADGVMDTRTEEHEQAREELVQEFLAERGEALWPKAPSA